MAKILFLTLVFPPDSVSTAQIMGDLATDLHTLGHEVEVITTTPHYNLDLEAEKTQPRQNRWGRILQKSSFQSIPVYHIKMPKKSASILARIPALLFFHIISILAGILIPKKPQVIIVPSPPLTIALCAWLIGKFHHAPYIYNVQEIYPDYAIELGTIQNKWLIKQLYWLESFVYKRAHAVTVIAPHMMRRLLEKRVPQLKIRVIPNFVDIDNLQPLPKDNAFSQKYNIVNKFVVSYAGNIGPSQDLESFVAAAELLRENTAIQFMMMGDGMLREPLMQSVSDKGLPNFLFLPYQPYSLMMQIYAASNLCLVPQLKGIASVAVPSKVYRIMACARPVLASTNEGSDLANLVMEAKCGIIVEAGNPEKLAEVISNASQAYEKLQQMGNAGREHVMQFYSRQIVTQKYHELVLSITQS